MDNVLVLKQHFTFPFNLHDYQEESLNEMAVLDRVLLRYKVGLGKTCTATSAALLYAIEDEVEQVVVLCPPILLDQWAEYLNQIKGIEDITVFRGTPKDRDELDIENSSIVLMSYNIFRGKKDLKRIDKLFKLCPTCIIADELSLKDLNSKTYRMLKKVMYRKMRLQLGDQSHHKLIALNATPISDLSQVYNWCSLFVPGVYKSKKQFLDIHAEAQDPWGGVTEWTGQERMAKNMELFTVDTSKEVKLPPIVKTDVPYELSKDHMRLYKDIKRQALDELPEDIPKGQLDLIVKSLFSSLQRVVLLPSDFGLDIRSPVLEFIEGHMKQMADDDGLIVYSRHVAVSEMLAAEIPDCGAIYGKIKKEERERVFSELKAGRLKRLVGNMDSLGVGLNLQMLNHSICVEIPFRDDKLIQLIGRTHRQGQQKSCFVYYPLALNTIQYKIYHDLLNNGVELGSVIRDKKDIEAFLS